MVSIFDKLNPSDTGEKSTRPTQPPILIYAQQKLLPQLPGRSASGRRTRLLLRQKGRARKDHYNLSRLKESLPGAVEQVKPFAQNAKPGKKILFFATLHYWIEQASFISLTLAGLGHKVTLMTLPYSEWHKEMDKLTQRQRALIRRTRSPH